jgi:3-hydroxy-9,10-secoandrosta-1,3,5(10)-triene-9,17-dione monooxygenase
MAETTSSAAQAEPTIPTDEELLERARRIGPSLVKRQAETETLGRYAEDTHKAFSEAGFYRMLIPKRFGGYECNLETYFKVVREIARNCPSTGWMLSQSINHTITVGSFFSEEAQAAIFAEGGGEFRAPLTAKPEGTAEPTADGGWKITGTFHYNSGAPYSTHMMSHAIPTEMPDGSKPEPMLFIARRDQYEVLDDWGDVLGLKGSGSNSIKFDGGYIPGNYALPGQTFLTLDPKQAVGRELHENPMYAGSTLTFFLLGGANVATGTAMGAVDEYEDLLRTKQIPSPPFTPRTEDQDYQRWFGTAYGQVATAQAALDSYARQWIDLSARRAWTREEDLRLAGICREVVNNLCWTAVHTVLRTAGSSSIRNGQRMERVWRDYSQLYSHGWAFLHDIAARDLTRERVGAALAAGDWSPTFNEGARA